MSADTKQWTLGVLTGVIFTSLTAIGYSKLAKQSDPINLIPKDIITAYNQGIKDALRTNPASWELEETCLGLWAGKQQVSVNTK